jgi:putative CocE/NonD family hydrolase
MTAPVRGDSQLDSVDVHWNVKVPLRDGVHLTATLYRPRNQCGPSPCILTLTPYVADSFHERGTYFAANGFTFVVVDVRGRGNSEGVFRPNIQEVSDGVEVVEWLAAQSYCNGQIGMWGGSYGGYSQWAIAKSAPKSLSTIVPVAAPYIGVDFPMCHNIWPSYVVQWIVFTSGRTSQTNLFSDSRLWASIYRTWYEEGRTFCSLDEALNSRSNTFQEWLQHPSRDSYWDSYNPTSDEYARMRMPILTITGCYDGDQLGALEHYRQFMRVATPEARSRHFLIIGPWDHSGTRTPRTDCVGLKLGPESLVDLPRLHVQWYRWTMQGGPRPEFLQKNVAYYVMGSERWRYVDTLEEVTSHLAPLYLGSHANPTDVFSAGFLSGEPQQHAEPDRYVYDPRDVSRAEIESLIDPEDRTEQRLVLSAFGRRLVYHSAPLADDVEISGFFTLSVWLSIDQPDTDFVASIFEIAIDGSSVLLTSHSMRARYRESLREEKLIGSDETLPYHFNNFPFIARQLKKGSRLRLVFGPSDSMHSQRNFNSGGIVAHESMADARAVSVRLFHDAAHPSVLHVPLGQGASELKTLFR